MLEKGKGIGKLAAIQLFNQFRGKWTVTQIEKNYPAHAFWKNVIGQYTKHTHTEYQDDAKRTIQQFDNRS
ncbi:hypothetical protein LCL95_11070 [Bacillus timonensis]|nr:hypothetical protein [Bacillus timonensis]